FDRMISEWRFKHMVLAAGEAVEDMADNPDFDTWFGRRIDEALAQPITRLMMQMPNDVTPQTAHAAFDRDFVAVGVSERFSDTVRLFAAVLGKPYVPDQPMNVTTYGRAGDYDGYRPR